MNRYIIGRVLFVIPIMLILSFFTFALTAVAPLHIRAGATSPRESFGFPRGAAADPLRMGGGAYSPKNQICAFHRQVF